MRDIPSLLMMLGEIAWRRRYLIVVPMLALPPIAFVAGGLAPKSYVARSTILVQETAKLNPFLNDLAVGPNLKERMPALKTLVHSSHILEAVLEDTGAINAQSPADERASKVRALSSSISVDLMGNDLVGFSIRGGSPKGMAATLTALTRHFVEKLLAPERSSIKDSQVFLRQELDERSMRLEEVQQVYAEFKRTNSTRLPNLESSLVTRLSALEQKLSDNRMALKAAEAQLGDVRQRLIGTNPVIGRIEDDIMKATRRLGELKTRYTEEHSAVQAELRILKRLEAERETQMGDANAMQGADLDRLWNLAAGSLSQNDGKTPPLLISQMTRLQESNSEYLRLKEETAALEKEITGIHTAIAETGPVLQEQKRLEEEMRLAQESHDAISKRFDNAKITGALGEFEAPERIKVIDAPVDPVAPVTPGRILFLIAGILAGILAGAGLAAAAEILDTRLRRQPDFEAVCNAPVVARYCN